jgi:type III secretory pathway component EscU
MSILPNFLRSLVLTSLFSFTAPAILLGGIMASLLLIGYVPHFQTLSQVGTEQLSGFLSTFGSGDPLHGVVVIGLTCSLVGGLFDTYAFYRYQNLRDN